MSAPPDSELALAAAQLGRTESGRKAMRVLLDTDGKPEITVDAGDQPALFLLLRAAWSGRASQARSLMRQHSNQPLQP